MNINTLTIKAQEALQAALSLARERGQQAVEPLHLLAVLILSLIHISEPTRP